MRLTASAALLALSLLLGVPAGSAAAAGTSAGYSVTGAEVIEHTALTLQGAVTVEDGGSLTLESVELTIAPSATAAPALVVKPGGTLVVRNSTIRSQSLSAADGVRVELGGAADIRATTFMGLAADASRAVGRALALGFKVAPGGVVITSDDVQFAAVTIQSSAGCAVTVLAASPTLRDLTIEGVAYRADGVAAFAGGVCVSGGSPTIDGLQLSAIGSAAQGAPGALYSAGVVADTPYRITVRNIGARGFAPALSGHPAPTTAAVVIQDPAFVVVSGGAIEGVSDGVVIRGSTAPSQGGSVVIEQLSIVNTASGPVWVVAPYSSDPGLNWNHLDITGCSGNGLYFESQFSGTSTAVTATVDNVTAKNCGGVGINLFDNGAQGAHSFNVWSSNASGNGQEGFLLHGVNMGAGLNIQMADNGAYGNSYSGIRVSATYSSGGAAKIASGKFEHNTADNNSFVDTGSNGGGVFLQFGSPASISMRYLYNTARGNGNNMSFATFYGHYIEVHATNSLIIGTGWMTGLVSTKNTDVGLAIIGGGGGVRIDGVRINDSTISGQPTGIHGENARIEVWNSTLGNAAEFEGLLTGFYAMGSVHTRLTGTTTGLYKIISYKQICMTGQWQNGAPLYLLPLSFLSGTNNSQAQVFSDVSVDPPIAAGNRQTDTMGNWSGWVLDWTYDPQLPAAQNQRADYAPLTIAVQLYQEAAKSPAFDLNTNICGTIQFTDPNPPDLVVSSPRENATYTHASITVQGVVTDGLSGVAGLQVSLDGANWTDILAPLGPFTYTYTGLADGVYDVFLRAWDRANDGLVSRAETLVVLYGIGIDTIPPALSLILPPIGDGGEFWTSNSQIFFSGRIDQNTTELYANGQLITPNGTAFLYIADLPNEGPQSFLFLAIDKAGNTRNLTVTIYKDTVAPTLIVTSPLGRGEIFVNTHDLLVTGITDPNTVLTVNGAVTPVANGTFSTHVALTEGSNTVDLFAVDAAGNPTSRSLLVTADTVAPTVEVTSHSDGMYLNASRLELDGTISEPLQFLEINLRIFPFSGATFAAVMGLAEGPNLISVNATDRAGNVGRLTLVLNVDTKAPSIVLFSLADYAVQNLRQLHVHGAVSEAATVTVNSVTIDVTALEFDTALTLSEGMNTIEVTATDLAGNRVTVVRHVTLDTQDPTVEVSDPKPGDTVHSRIVRIVGTAEPNSTVLVGSQLLVADASGRFFAWVVLETDGLNQVNITVTDAAGNSVSKVFAVNYAPAVTDTSGDLYLGLVLMVVVAVALFVAGRFLIKKRVDGEVARAIEAQQAQEARQDGMPGYTEYGQAPPYAPEGGYPEAAEAPPETAVPPPPPRAPRPPRPPTN